MFGWKTMKSHLRERLLSRRRAVIGHSRMNRTKMSLGVRLLNFSVLFNQVVSNPMLRLVYQFQFVWTGISSSRQIQLATSSVNLLDKKMC